MPALTHKEYFEEEMQRGICNDNADHRKVFKPLADLLSRQRTVFEIGCGTGLMIELLDERGVVCVGCDPNPYHHAYFITRNPELYDRFVLLPEGVNGEIHGQYDAVLSIEVFEHLTEAACRHYLEQAQGKCQYFVFSSTSEPDPEWDERWGHINLHDQQYWVDLFAEYGFKLFAEIKTPVPWTKIFKAV